MTAKDKADYIVTAIGEIAEDIEGGNFVPNNTSSLMMSHLLDIASDVRNNFNATAKDAWHYENQVRKLISVADDVVAISEAITNYRVASGTIPPELGEMLITLVNTTNKLSKAIAETE